MSSPATQPRPSRTVVELVAGAENVDPTDLEPPLYDVVDPDALDALFAPTSNSPRVDGQVTFEYCGHPVVVSSDGTVVLADKLVTPPRR